MSHKAKTIIGTAALIAAAVSNSAHGQDTIPAINDQNTGTQSVEIYQPLRPQAEQPQTDMSQGQLPPAPEMEVTPLPQQAVPPTLAAPLMTMPVPQGATRSAPANLYQAPISSLPSIADLVARVSPSVVNIIVTTEDGQTTSEGQGSGFLISSQKEVVTNYHVIDGGTNIEIEFNNGEKFPASIIGTDEETDLALLRIESDKSFPHVDFHSGPKERIGDWVVAIGNPFGIGQSTSLGVISAIGRSRVDSGSYVDYIQTDATINRGNSGGPLFNLDGDVVGVNSAIYSPTGASVGIAFVIPHSTAKDIIDSIRVDGEVRRGYLGAGLRTATFEMENRPGIYKSGATINNVVPGSPAEQYGLQVDDIILNINGKAVRNSVQATRAIGGLAPGDIARMIYERGEKTYEVRVSIGERPQKEQIERANAIAQGLPVPEPKRKGPKINIDTGLQVLDLSSEFRSAIGMRPDQVGIYVESVTPGSGAEQGGFRTGMVILDADGTPMAETGSLKTVVLNARLANQDGLIMNVRLKDGRETFMVLPL